ncbi:MAG TPA: heme-binding domain-containing protein [Thermoanaerobaculia bacterium]|nr:heme-binding domain-containing protein [Thermoanaerobaculia bacterium]
MPVRQLVVRLLVAIAVVALLIQAIPVERKNAAVTSNVDAPPAVVSILRRACYDCHSNETVWPRYSRVAPVSWLVAHDVHEGRRELDFSTWDRYDAVTRRRKLDRAAEEVSDGDMPPVYYVWMHPAARLSDADRAALKDWFARP